MLKRGVRNAVDNRPVENRNAIFLEQENAIEKREGKMVVVLNSLMVWQADLVD